MSTHSQSKSKVVIAGGGFGGVHAARLLGRAGYDVTLISSSDHLTYYPQLYHTATGGSRAHTYIPLRPILDKVGVRLIEDTVDHLDTSKHTVTLASGKSQKYGKLMLGLGSITNYFGIPGLKEHAHDIKTIEGSEGYKRSLHDYMTEHGKPDDNYVVIGAGPTGVELAASLAPYLKLIAKLHGLSEAKPRVVVVEAAPRILPRSSEDVSRRVQKRLESLGIEVMTGVAVKGADAKGLDLGDSTMKSHTVVWTSGVSNNPFYKANESQFKLNERGYVVVDEHFSAADDVYVTGDNAAVQFAGLAQTAIQHASFVSQDIMNLAVGKPRAAFKPKTPITVIPVGQKWAAAQYLSTSMYGLTGDWLRTAADLVGYADIMPLPPAIRTVLSGRGYEHKCSVCDATSQPEAATSEA